MVDVAQIQSAYNKMNTSQQRDFLKSLGISDINGVNMVNLFAAENYFKSHGVNLSETNVWAKYNQAKADWNTHHAQYTNANKLYHNLKDQKDVAHADYTKLKSKYIQNNNGEKLSSAQETKIRNESGYTTDVIKNTNDAESFADLLLAKCYQDVDAQWNGLNRGILG